MIPQHNSKHLYCEQEKEIEREIQKTENLTMLFKVYLSFFRNLTEKAKLNLNYVIGFKDMISIFGLVFV